MRNLNMGFLNYKRTIEQKVWFFHEIDWKSYEGKDTQLLAYRTL